MLSLVRASVTSNIDDFGAGHSVVTALCRSCGRQPAHYALARRALALLRGVRWKTGNPRVYIMRSLHPPIVQLSNDWRDVSLCVCVRVCVVL
jgi:hypothetical protein